MPGAGRCRDDDLRPRRHPDQQRRRRHRGTRHPRDRRLSSAPSSTSTSTARTGWRRPAGGSWQPGSSIINIASVLGITTGGLPQAAYSASKAGVMGLTRDLAQQWGGRKGIRVNAIAPGFFKSEMTDEYKPGYLEQPTAADPVGPHRRPRGTRRDGGVAGVAGRWLRGGTDDRRRRWADDLLGREDGGHRKRPANGRGVPPCRRAAKLGATSQDALQRHGDLEARQGCADAIVRAVAEGQRRRDRGVGSAARRVD